MQLKVRRHFPYAPLIIKKLLPNETNLLIAKKLHFGQVTRNNKLSINNLPNPQQCYFNLIVEMKVVAADGQAFSLYSVESEEKIIVRVSKLKCNQSDIFGQTFSYFFKLKAKIR